MRTMMVMIFLLISSLIMAPISFYIFIRGLQSIPHDSSLRHPYMIIFWIVAFSFALGRALERILPSILSDVFVWIGSFWIAAMIYFFMAVVVLDVLRLINHFLPFFPSMITDDYSRAKGVACACVTGMVGLLLLGGHINAMIPRIRNLEISIPKQGGTLKTLNIVMASDIHLGTIVGRSRINNIADKINSLHPDLVLLPGDIVDEDLAPVIKQNLGESLKSIRAPLGVYACTGNHEYIGGVEKACAYLAEHNIVFLRDQSIKIGDSFYLVGREDRSAGSIGGHPRKELHEIMKDVDKKYPVILMDHQPFGLNQAVIEGVDLQLSGHTHYGQLWPVSYIVRSIYELAWGYRRIAGTSFYVSDGVGTWGPPVRVGNRPEIVQIHLSFQ